jgi:hypothetical protein
MKDLVMNMEDMYGNKAGVFSTAVKLLNRASVDRTISKQKTMCLLAQLPLVLCSEKIEPVYLSPSRRICNQIEAKKDKEVEDTSWIMEYERRTGNSTLCFHHYMTGVLNRKKTEDVQRDCTPLHWVHTILFISLIGDLLLSSIIGIQTMVKIKSSVKQSGQNLSGPVFKICFIANMSTDNTTCI